MPQMIRRQWTVGIVGAEAAKFTPENEVAARKVIQALVRTATCVVSGGCHLGGVDIWAADIGRALDKVVVEHYPAVHRWNGTADNPGYRERNLKIAHDSDEVVCVTVRELPPDYVGMRCDRCYHCSPNADPHIKSGGCWTVKQAILMGKQGRVVIV